MSETVPVEEAFSFSGASHPLRPDIPIAFRRAWEHIATPGPAWSGKERVAIAQESRDAWDCALCNERKNALSPNAAAGTHASTKVLPAVAVEAIHRMTTDPGRLTERWFESLLTDGLTDTQYVEILGIVGTLTSIDTFHRSLSIPIETLPKPRPGEPTGYRPERLKAGGSWLPLLTERNLAKAERDMYGGLKQGANVLRCMSLVPDEVRNLLQISKVMYLSDRDVPNFKASGGRAISRDQIEMLSSRVSVLNECFY